MTEAPPPRLSILLCTYNGAGLLPRCLDSILRQNLRDFEVLCIDGGSADDTRTVIADYASRDPRVRLVNNPKRLPEGRGNGKWLGATQARGEFLAVIDQDNALQRTDLFEVVLRLFAGEQHLVGVLGGLSHDRNDEAVVRYVSLFGTDSFFAYRSVDFLRSIGCAHRIAGSDQPEHETLPMSTDNMPLTGGNCFFYRRADVERAGGYDQDVLLLKRMIPLGKNIVAVVPHATKHYAEESLTRLALKKFFWAQRFFEGGGERFDYMPRTSRERMAFGRNFIFSILVLPNFYYAWRVFRRSHEPAAWLYPLLAWLNTLAYGLNFFGQKLRSRRG